ncbi:VOC family protein [Galbibacter mesophilus]|uniref:VOC family protein n=1 Tax=Galbibacter mesophilus TaxID=379069 RepID=UPI00191F2FE7|nr:VOC family protein [Galbibacter mesophilus]MCM5661456.1 VOC family protein [Galbibacter mesophilus]
MKNAALPNPATWFEIYVTDMNRAKKFYEEVFQTTMQHLPNPTEDDMEMYTFPSDMNNHGAGGALAKMEGVSPGNNSTLIYFGSKDCSVEENRVEKAGGKIFKPKMAIGQHGFIVLASDTEGNMFGVHSME